MKYIWHFLKQMIVPLVYMILLSITCLGITSINNDLLWLKYLLDAVVLVFFGIILGGVSFKDGEDACKILHANDAERRRIIETGEDRPIDRLREYKPWKGFMIGLSACVPLIIMLIIHACRISIDPTQTQTGALAGYIYMVTFSFFLPNLAVTVSAGYYFYTLIAIPVFALMTGVPYILGYRKMEKQYEMIARKHREIYGDK